MSISKVLTCNLTVPSSPAPLASGAVGRVRLGDLVHYPASENSIESPDLIYYARVPQIRTT
jgi:hypothetical protein